MRCYNPKYKTREEVVNWGIYATDIADLSYNGSGVRFPGDANQ